MMVFNLTTTFTSTTDHAWRDVFRFLVYFAFGVVVPIATAYQVAQLLEGRKAVTKRQASLPLT